MMRKLARGTVRARYVILILMLALAVLSAMSIGRTKINYDLSKYLDESTMTPVSERSPYNGLLSRIWELNYR